MSYVLISFCNLSERRPSLAIFDFDTERLAWIGSEQAQMLWHGVDGICQRAGAYWFLPQVAWGGISALARLGEDPVLSFYAPLTKTRDAHSLVPYLDGFLVVDTQRNRLMYVEPRVDGTVCESEYWKYCDAEHDVVHVNSVTRLGSDVYVSLLGEKPADGWSHAVDGMIFNVSRNKVVCNGLRHPHSLVNIRDCLYWLESGTGAVHCFDPCHGHQVIAQLENYVRGLAYDDSYLYVGASGSRPVSRSTGQANAPINQDADEAYSWIYRLHRGDLSVERKRSAQFPREIYDLAHISPLHAQVYLKQEDGTGKPVWEKAPFDETGLARAA